jgi:hypothetical protein
MRDREDATKRAPAEASAASAGQAGKATLADSANVDLTHLNDHPGFDANRLGNHKQQFHTVKAGALYNDDGLPITSATVPAHKAVNINAGAITKLALRDPANPAKRGAPVECVFIFDYDGHSGWMPASCLPDVVTREQNHLAGAIAHERGDAGRKFGKPRTIKRDASAKADGVDDLFTYPHQGVTKKNRHQNEAKYYYGNLALNLPDTGGERVGVDTDGIPGVNADDEHEVDGHSVDPYREFYPEDPDVEKSIPLYARGSRHPASKRLHFVFGYVKNDGGGKIYGWINKSMLGGDAPATKT